MTNDMNVDIIGSEIKKLEFLTGFDRPDIAKEEHVIMKIGNDIYYVGVNDHQIDLFEGQYVVPNGMSYNSYVIMDEKIAVMDTVEIGRASCRERV